MLCVGSFLCSAGTSQRQPSRIIVRLGTDGFFALFNGVAAWSIYQSKTGRYLGSIVVLPWFGSLVNIQGRVGGLTLVLAVLIALVGIWLYLPGVRAKFEVKKVFA